MGELRWLQMQLEQNAKLRAQKEKTFFAALGYANRVLNAAKLSGEELEMRLLSTFNDRAIVADVIEAISEEGR